MSPVKVLYLIDSLGYGGTEKQLVQLLENVDCRKVEPHLGTLKPSSGLYDEVTAAKFCLGFDSLLKPAVARSVYRLASYIRRNDIQVVQTFFQDPFVLAAMSSFFHRARLVGSFRDLGFWRNSKESLKMQLAARRFEGFLANSQAVKDHFVATDGLEPDKVSVIYNGFDTERLQSSGSRERSLLESPLVGIVANLNRPVKRVEDFIAAAAMVYQQHSSVRFIIIGDGHLRLQLEALAATLGVAEAIDFAGSLENPLEHVPRFAVGLITSETEGFSNAIVEYMACGVPVVATDTGGNSELVENGVNGFLVPVGDTQLMAEKILALLDPQTNLQIGAQNRHKILTQFTKQAMVSQHEDYYARISGDRG